MTKSKLIKFDPLADEYITPAAETARAQARPRRRRAPYHRDHRTVSASVSNDLAEWLSQSAVERGMTRSALIAEILTAYRRNSDGSGVLL